MSTKFSITDITINDSNWSEHRLNSTKENGPNQEGRRAEAAEPADDDWAVTSEAATMGWTHHATK